METTTEIKHTPGPWVANEIPHYDGYRIRPAMAVAATLADARLIAAAPTMLAALQAAEDVAAMGAAVNNRDYDAMAVICDRYPQLSQDMSETAALLILVGVATELRRAAIAKAVQS